MMRATIVKRACVYCGDESRFQRECTGPRGGHIRWEDCCIDCGERPGKRASLAQQGRAKESQAA